MRSYTAADRRQGMTLEDLRAVLNDIPDRDGTVRVLVGFRSQIQKITVETEDTPAAKAREQIQQYWNGEVTVF